jgi:hypothetical protein
MVVVHSIREIIVSIDFGLGRIKKNGMFLITVRFPRRKK